MPCWDEEREEALASYNEATPTDKPSRSDHLMALLGKSEGSAGMNFLLTLISPTQAVRRGKPSTALPEEATRKRAVLYMQTKSHLC